MYVHLKKYDYIVKTQGPDHMVDSLNHIDFSNKLYI